jgi:hypothetical protein
VSWNDFMNDESLKEKNLGWRVVLKSCKLSFFIGDFVISSSEQATIHNFECSEVMVNKNKNLTDAFMFDLSQEIIKRIVLKLI